MPLQIPHPNTPLHLYRHLLREASYLPPLCRPWIISRIQTRHRDCQHKIDTKLYIQEAHHHLRYLRSANTGHVARILHLCYLATGRIGKRRRQLATLFLTKDPPADTAHLEGDIPSPHHESSSTSATTSAPSTTNSDKRKNPNKPDDIENNREPDWLDNWAMDKLQTIAASQVAHQGGNWPHSMRRSYDPKRGIPTENAFGRPFPQKVARNKLKKHYTSILHQLLPPLPQGEWDRLKDLTNGRASSPDDLRMPVRRIVAQPILDEERGKETRDQEWGWMQYVTKPVRALERKNSRKMKSLTSELDQDPRGQGRPIGVRTLGSRKLRRGIYGRLFELSPAMTQNPKSGQWRVSWGSSELKVSKPTSTTDLEFFQGVDNNGKLTKQRFTRMPT